MTSRSLLPEEEPVRRVDAHSAAEQPPGAALATDDQLTIGILFTTIRVDCRAAIWHDYYAT
jgi:hypothetical protein